MKYSKKLAWNKTLCITLQVLLASSSGAVWGDLIVEPGTSNATVYVTPSGIPAVNISTANGAGVSHNQFTNYDVDSRGLVLNNVTSAQGPVQSQLAGQVTPNINLNSAAPLIINEVVQPNSSSLAGYTEVAGAKADVMVVNPYGITCSGCGFINTDRATLTTGALNFNNNGSLSTLVVTQGNVLINSTGADLTQQQTFDIVARSVTIEGQVNAQALKILAGANTYNYTADTYTVTGGGTAPTYAIDTSILGGMYAHTITLIATEAGVGVQMLGDAAASANDFSLTAAGEIILTSNAISAVDGNITLATTQTGATALSFTDAQLSAGESINLIGTNNWLSGGTKTGGATLIGGVFTATDNLNYYLTTLSDTGDVNNGITNNNQRYANTIALNTSGAASLNGVKVGAAEGWTGNFGSLSVGSSGATLYSGDAFSVITAENMSLAAAAISAGNGLSLTSGSSMSTSVGGEIQAVAGDVSMSAGELSNAGAVSAKVGALTLETTNLSNTGLLQSAGDMSIASDDGGPISNSGTIYAGGSLTATGGVVANTGSWQATTGATFTATSLTNSGTFIASNTTGDASTFTLSNGSSTALTNTGTVQAADSLTFTVTGTVSNSGKILSSNNLTLVGTSSNTLAVNNKSGGILQATNAVSVYGYGAGSDAIMSTQAGTILGNAVHLNLGSAMTNTGFIQGGAGASSISVDNTLTNSSGGRILLSTSALGSGTIQAITLTNSGTIQSTGAMTLDLGFSGSAGTLTNNVGGSILGTNAVTIQNGDSGAAYNLYDYGRIQSSGGALTIQAGSGHTGNNVYVGASGVLLGNTLSITSNALDVGYNGGAVNGGMVSSISGMTINTSGLTFGGTGSAIVASTGGSGDSSITIANSFSNQASIYSGWDLTLTAPVITNTSTGVMGAAQTLMLTASGTTGTAFTNAGALYAGGELNIGVPSAAFLNQSGTGTLNSSSHMSINALTFTNNNVINAAGHIVISATTFNNSLASGSDPRTYTVGDTNSGAYYWGTMGGTDALSGYWNAWISGGGAPSQATILNNSGSVYEWTNVYGCGFLDFDMCVVQYDHQTWALKQSYTTTPTITPKIIAGNNLTIENFTTATNLGGILSSGPTSGETTYTLTLSGTTFNNYDLALDERDYVATFQETCMSIFWGLSGCSPSLDESTIATSFTEKNIYNFGAGLFGNTVSVSGVTTLTNVGSTLYNSITYSEGGPISGTVTTLSRTGASTVSGVSGITAATAPTALTFDSFSVTLPTSNPTGYFIPYAVPDESYVIETNPLYSVESDFVGGSYLAGQLAYNPATIGTQIGNANYEPSSITQQITSQTGNNLLSGSQNAGQSVQPFLTTTAATAGGSGLAWGEAPTAGQLANLGQSIVWMVNGDVNGRNVLKPAVYLSPSTVKSIQEEGLVIEGSDANVITQ